MLTYTVVKMLDGSTVLEPVNELQEAINISLVLTADTDLHYIVYSHEKLGNLNLRREVYNTQSLRRYHEFITILRYSPIPHYAANYN